MNEPLPHRRSRLWLPALGDLVEYSLLVFQAGEAGPRGKARLRAWQAGDGYFALLTDLGPGLGVARAQPGVRKVLTDKFGEPLALAEHWPDGHVYLVLPPVPGEDTERVQLHPALSGDILHDYVAAWWAAHGDTVLSP